MKEGKPSATARIVAMNIMAVAESPDFHGLVSAETRALTARLLGAGGALSRRLPALLAKPWARGCFGLYERLTIPGLALHQALRKRRLEEAVAGRLEKGVRQLVVLGGGFDTLAARLAPRHPAARFIELDHPATQAVKRRALAEAGALGGNLSLHPLDFNRRGLREGLLALPSFRPDEPACFVCEGVLMYLDPQAVERLLADLASLPGAPLAFAFTFMEPGPGGHVAFRGSSPLVAAWLRLRGERFTWGASAAELPALMARHGFALEEIAGASELASRYLSGYPKAPLAEGEMVALAIRR